MGIYIKKYPEELIKDRAQLEGMFVFALWKSPDRYCEYKGLIEPKKFFLNKEARFYYILGYYLDKKGYKSFDEPSVDIMLNTSEKWRERFDELGGHEVVAEMMAFTDPDNLNAMYDDLVKSNTLLDLYENPRLDIISNLERFDKMSASEVQDWYENTVENIFIQSNTDIRVETLELSDEDITDIFTGSQMGFDYSENCPRLNYITMGIPKGELTMIAAHSGVGKTSFVFNNIIMPLTDQGIKCAIISNEQRAIDFKNLLIVYVLQKFLGIRTITRKKLKNGKLTDEEKEAVIEAQDFITNNYSQIKFIKMFDNNMSKVKKIIKALASDGYEAFMFDTMKSEDAVDERMWQQLIQQSRDLFQLASKYNLAIVTTYQLALHTLNKRFLNAMCLSNGKQIKEVFSEMIYFRDIWDDEFEGEKFDIHPYDYSRESGRYEKVETRKPLLRGERYIVAFIDKTRNDEGKKQIVYRFNGAFNHWEEIGYCTVLNDHK